MTSIKEMHIESGVDHNKRKIEYLKEIIKLSVRHLKIRSYLYRGSKTRSVHSCIFVLDLLYVEY